MSNAKNPNTNLNVKSITSSATKKKIICSFCTLYSFYRVLILPMDLNIVKKHDVISGIRIVALTYRAKINASNSIRYINNDYMH